ncbi:MAG TPA: hypothetical protein ENG03_02275 [Thioploca sp.]|nr:hypothetical protein [Thioploca sp.]
MIFFITISFPLLVESFLLSERFSCESTTCLCPSHLAHQALDGLVYVGVLEIVIIKQLCGQAHFSENSLRWNED